MEYTSKDRGFYTTMLGTSVYPKNTKTKQSENFRTAVPTVKKASSFLEDYEERVKSKQQELAKPLKIDLPSEQSGKSASEGIKKRISTVLSKKYGELDTKHLFDDIDDSEIEKNIPLARNTVETSLERGTIKNEFLEKLPNLVDGLALSFAAAEKGNNKAATRAREAAYMEGNTRDSNIGNTTVKRPLETLLQRKYQQSTPGKRYVKSNVENLDLISAPGMDNASLAKLPRGTQVDYTGNKVSLGDKQWAEVEYNGQKGWVDASWLKIDKPEDKTEKRGSSSVQTSSSSNVNGNRIDLSDHDAIQSSFYEDTNGSRKLQCSDASIWFIKKYTTLKLKDSGNHGTAIVHNTKEENGLKSTTTPCAPALFSVHKGTFGPGIKDGGVSHETYGHTGIILNCVPLGNNEYLLTYFHTYDNITNSTYNSSIIVNKKFKESENVTYLYLGDHMKQ